MATKKENALAILDGRQPEYYFDFMNALALIPDPLLLRDLVPQDGQIHTDTWGVEFAWQEGSPGQHPVGNPERVVITDIEKWEDSVVVPGLEGLDWSMAEQMAADVDSDELFVGCFCPGGLFERSHHLMGLEEALVNYMTYEDEVAALLRVIADYKIDYIRCVAEKYHPEVIFYHDDWGSKTNVFLPPDLWRRLIKPLHEEIIHVAHDCDMIFMHHADCYCRPLVKDMVEMGVDIWQGVIPQNDIIAIQKETEGKLAMVGGVNGPAVDMEGVSEEDIRAEARRTIDAYCPGGRFFPGIPNGELYVKENDAIIKDELETYGRQWALEHPVNA